jgi:hypothetical protein
LLNHPDTEVVEGARRVLRTLGETIAAAPEAPPVRFQVFLNGKPVAPHTSLGWRVEFGEGGSVSSTQEADEQGRIAVERKHFIDARRPPTAVTLSCRSFDSAESPYFSVQLPVPADLTQPTRVDAEVFAVRLHIEPAQSRAGGGSAKIQITRHQSERADSERYVYFDPMDWRFDAPLGGSLTLSMQSGTYELQVLAPSSEQFKTTFNVPAKGGIVAAQLRQGGDLRFKIVRPDGERGAAFALLNGGEEVKDHFFDYKTDT